MSQTVSNVQQANEKVFDLHELSEKGNLKPHHKTLHIPRMAKINIAKYMQQLELSQVIGENVNCHALKNCWSLSTKVTLNLYMSKTPNQQVSWLAYM